MLSKNKKKKRKKNLFVRIEAFRGIQSGVSILVKKYYNITRKKSSFAVEMKLPPYALIKSKNCANVQPFFSLTLLIFFSSFSFFSFLII